MSNLYARRQRLSEISGEPGGDDIDGYGRVSGGAAAADAWSLLVALSALAASVVIWEACASVAMAAALVAGAGCYLSLVAASRSASPRAGTAEEDPAFGACCRGLAEVDIRALPASPFQRRRVVGGGPAGAVTCSVCLEEVRGGEMVRSLPECRHLFHVGCIDPWLHSHVTCPLCRSDLSPQRRATTMAGVAGPQQGASPSPRLLSL